MKTTYYYIFKNFILCLLMLLKGGSTFLVHGLLITNNTCLDLVHL